MAVGAGIVGLDHALAAVRRGPSVILIERDSQEPGASVRHFGHGCVTPQSGDALRYGLTARQEWAPREGLGLAAPPRWSPTSANRAG